VARVITGPREGMVFKIDSRGLLNQNLTVAALMVMGQQRHMSCSDYSGTPCTSAQAAARIVFEGVAVLDAKCAYFVGVPVLSRTPPSICGFPLFAPHCRPTTTVSDKPLVIS